MIFRKIVRLPAVIAPERLRFAALKSDSYFENSYRVIFRKIVRLPADIAPERLRFAALNPAIILTTPIFPEEAF